jgi:hypothetical protein
VAVSDISAAKALSVKGRPLLAFCVLTIFAVLASYASRVLTDWGGDQGLTTHVTGTRFVLKVTAVSGAGASAGVRVGDLIDARTVPFSIPGYPTNEIDSVTVNRSGRPLTLSVRRVPGWPIEPDESALFLAFFWTACFALLIAWRGTSWAWSGPLAFILAFVTLGGALERCVLPYPALTASANLVGNIVLPMRYVLLTAFFASFGPRLTASRAFWTKAAYVLAAVAGITWYAFYILLWQSLVSTDSAPAFTLFEVLLTAAAAPTILCGVLAARAADPVDTQRVGWAVAAFGSMWFFWILAGPLGGIWYSIDKNLFDLFWEVATLSQLLLPLCLSYAALTKRLFDVGFVINRTAVFGVLSTIVIGSFVLLEWATGKWFEGASHTTSLVLNGALALGLGLSLRFIHSRVDAIVDRVFFRRRNENERRLKRFAREAAFITTRDVLLERTAQQVLENSEISSVAVVTSDRLPENDPATLALAAWHEPIDLTGCKTQIAGEYAFPILGGGELRGAILCGPKVNRERYAPDEIDTLKEVAQGVGTALWRLDVNDGSSELAKIFGELQVIRRLMSATELG